MKKVLLIFILIPLYLFADNSISENKVVNTLDQFNQKIKEISDENIDIKNKQDFIIKNYEIQNSTILYVSTILGFLLAVIIVYYGWRAQKVDNEYERIKMDRDKFNETYNNIYKELRTNLNIIENIKKEININMDELNKERNNYNHMIEGIVLDYLQKNAENLYTETRGEEAVTQFTKNNTLAQEIEDINKKLKLLESIQHESNSETIYKRIDILFTSKQYSEVIKIMENIVEDSSFKKQYFFQYAYSLSEQNQADKSKKYYEEYLKNYENSTAAINNLGLLYKDDNLQKAIDYFRKALSLESNIIYIRNLIGCYSDEAEQLKIYHDYSEKFMENADFISDYTTFLEEKFYTDELLIYHKNILDQDNDEGNFCNYYEAAVISQNKKTINELNDLSVNYNFSRKYEIIFIFLKALDKYYNFEEFKTEINKINLLIESSSDINISWRFNLIDKFLTFAKNNNTEDIQKCLAKLKSLDKKNPTPAST